MKKGLLNLIFGGKLHKQPEAQEALYARHLMWENPDQIESFFDKVSKSKEEPALNWLAEDKAQVRVHEAIYGKKDLRLHNFPRLNQELKAWKKRYRKMQNQVFPEHLLITWQVELYEKKARLTHHFFAGELFLIEFDLKYFSRDNMCDFLARFIDEKDVEGMCEQQERRFQPFSNNELYLSAFNNVGYRAFLAAPNPAFLEAAQKRRNEIREKI